MAFDPIRNHAIATITTGYDIDDVTIVLAAGHGAYLPDPATEGAFNLVWWNSTDYKNPSLDPLKEIVRVTARSTDTLTVTRPAIGNSYNGEGSDNVAHAHNITGRQYKFVLTPTRKYMADFQGELNKKQAIVTVGFADATYLVDGVADDVQIQAAITYVASLGGGRVHINGSSTNYDITAKVTIPSEVILEGDGAATVLKANATLLGTINMFENSDTAGGNVNIIVKDIKFDGNQTNRTGAFGAETGHCVMLKNCNECAYLNVDVINGYSSGLCFTEGTHNSLMHKCTVKNSKYHNILVDGDGVGTNPCYENTISDCYASGAGVSGVFGVGIEIANYAIRNTIVGCVSTLNLEGGINIYFNSSNNKVIGNTFTLNTQNGVSIVDVSDYNLIVGNTISGNTRVGISSTVSILAYGGKHCVIADNMIYNNGMNGIRGNVLDKWVITDNKIDNNGAGGTSNLQYGVYVGSAVDMVFEGNDVSNSLSRGVDMTDVTGLSCVGNKCHLNGAVGMQFNYVSVGLLDSVISNNVCNNNTTIGIIFLQGAARCVISGNVCRANTTSGIELRGAIDCIVNGNICSGNGTFGMRVINDASAVGTTKCRFIANRITGNTSGGLSETGAADNNVYALNDFSGNTTADFAMVGASNIVTNNSGVNPVKRYAQGNVTGATTFTRVNGSTIYATLTGDITVTLTNGIVVGDEMTLVLTQDATGSRVVTWPGTAKFGNGNTLALSKAANAVDVITLVWDGTNWREKSRALYIKSPRIVSMADATSITPTGDTADINTQINTQAVGTLTVNAPSGTPVHGQIIELEIKSTNIQTFSWNAIYRSSNDVVLPTASTGSDKTDKVLLQYHATDTKWDIIAKSLGY